MTTGLFATHSLPFGYDLHLELGRTRAVILALLATLCVAVTAPSAVRFERPVAEALARPVADLRAARLAVPAVARVLPNVGGATVAEIDALAASVAKRYRISVESTRGLIAAAYREGQRVGLDPLLIVAVIAVESRFNPIAESDSGAQGLMQVIPGYHKDKMEAAGVDSMLDPHVNIQLGAQILKDYIRRGGTETAGLQIYNGSSGDAGNAYAARVLGEKQRLQQAVQRLRERTRA